jgi:hypothetical protein
MDEGNADFTLTGWSGHRFIYTVTRSNYDAWQANGQVLKSYDAATGKITTLDQTAAEGNSSNNYHESIGSVFINTDQIVYAKSVYGTTTNDTNGHNASLNTVKPDGSSRQTVKSWGASYPVLYFYSNISVNARVYAPNQIYVAVYYSGPASNLDDNLYEFEDGSLKTVSGKKSNNLYDGDYTTYVFSPSDSKTFWSEPRDGKNTLLVGDNEGKNAKEVASLSDYQTYGWFTEKYLLISKNSSELYIMPASGGTPLKITDYYKPSTSFTGYGKGYGGL